MKSLLLFLFLATQLAGVAAAQSRPAPAEIDRIVAVVNDDVITLLEWRARVAQAEYQLRQQGIQLPPPQVFERQILERMVVDKVQLQFARETSLRVEDAQLERALGRIAENNKMNPAEFRAALEREGVPWEKFRDEVRNEMLIARLREREVDNRVSISEGEIDNYLANPARESAATELLLAHVLLRVPEQATPDQLMRVQAKAERARGELSRGADFAQVAAAYSDAPDGLSGGLLGWRSADRLPSLFAEAAERMQIGETSPLMRSPAGFHILKLVNRRGGDAGPQQVRQTRARHILIKVTEVVSEADARRKLVALRERIQNGADFGELAKLNSTDLSAARGGDLGWLYPGDTVPEFERAMEALQPNEVSEPVQSPFGWHLIQVLERRVADVSAERQRMVARQALRERKAEEAYQDWLRQLRDRAYVEYRGEER
jgi:peptidyl-prolyl cis-trans isomerase SurA